MAEGQTFSNDAQLLQDLQGDEPGSREAFSMLYRQYVLMLRGTLIRLDRTLTFQDCEDLAQQVFAEFWRNRMAFCQECSVAHYLVRTAKNLLGKHQPSESYRRRLELNVQGVSEDTDNEAMMVENEDAGLAKVMAKIDEMESGHLTVDFSSRYKIDQPGKPDDNTLLVQAASGDRIAFENLYIRHRPALLGFVRSQYSLDGQTAEDVIGDVFLRLFQRIHKLSIAGNVQSYLRAMARNIVVDRGRQSLNAHNDQIYNIESREPSIQTILEQGEISQKITQAVDSLAKSHRMAMALYQVGLTYKEIAMELHCTEKASQRRVEKAKANLKLSLSLCGRSCVIGTSCHNQCPSNKNYFLCIKQLYFQALRKKQEGMKV